jgi:transcriptional regulator with GAF, ATPase, and Fis domain
MANAPAHFAARTNDAVLRADEIRRLDRDNLLAALDRTGGKIYGPDGAAAVLGLKPTTLASRLRKLNLPAHLQPRAARK